MKIYLRTVTHKLSLVATTIKYV